MNVFTSCLGCETFEQLLKTFQLCRGMLGEILSAYEFLDTECMRLLNTHLKLPNPISGRHTRTHVGAVYVYVTQLKQRPPSLLQTARSTL